MNYKEEIINYCRSLGLDTIGFIRCRIFDELRPLLESRKSLGLQNEFEETEIEKRINPFLFMPEAKTIISIAFPYHFKGNAEAERAFSVYTRGRDYHKVVGDLLERISTFITELGGRAMTFVDSNPLPERHIAALSGIGFIGKNNMLITEMYGSYVFLGEILTELEVYEDTVISQDSEEDGKTGSGEKCGQCTLCLEACPTKAINERRRNCNVCLSYITQKKDIEDSWFNKLGGRIFGCDTCQAVCSYNRNISQGHVVFKPKDYMEKADLKELATLSNAVFKEKYSSTSCGWRGKNILQRNALIELAKRGEKINPDHIKSPYVRDYYGRLLKLFKL